RYDLTLNLGVSRSRVRQVDGQNETDGVRVVLDAVGEGALVVDVRVTVNEVDSHQANYFANRSGLRVSHIACADRTQAFHFTPLLAETLRVDRDRDAVVVVTDVAHQLGELTGQTGLTRVHRANTAVSGYQLAD